MTPNELGNYQGEATFLDEGCILGSRYNAIGEVRVVRFKAECSATNPFIDFGATLNNSFLPSFLRLKELGNERHSYRASAREGVGGRAGSRRLLTFSSRNMGIWKRLMCQQRRPLIVT